VEKRIKIPVLTFHSIGIENSSWSKRYLSSPLNHFEAFCKFLTAYKYETILMDDWYNLINGQYNYNKKYIVLTFDDGYLDNWVYVYPLLKKYNLKATIFINPEFVDPCEEPRLTLNDVWDGRNGIEELLPIGFLNWTEMQLMEKSGLVDIQSHSMTHNTYFKSDSIIDIYECSEKYDWLPWVYFKHKKPYYMKENLLNYIPRGIPIFEYDRSLAVRKFIPSQDFMDYCVSEYKRINKSQKRNKDVYRIIMGDYKNIGSIGRYETDNEMWERYNYELRDSKIVIENKLNKDIRYLCWPGGKYNALSLKVSVEVGYIASTATQKSYNNSTFSENNYKRMYRVGMGSNDHTSRSILLTKTNKGLIYCYKEYFGNNFERVYFKNKRRFLSILKVKRNNSSNVSNIKI
jgi:peptidoglycan/xylan/chitin deacetylase (PgdA/CDA1 family)